MSKGRPRSSERIFVEECGVLDVAELPRPVIPPEPDPEEARWHKFMYPNGRPNPSVGVSSLWADGQRTYASIKLTTTIPHFGGVRYWYVCPQCRRRVRKLYTTDADRVYACRHCWGLAYECQHRKSARQKFFRLLRQCLLATTARERERALAKLASPLNVRKSWQRAGG